MPKTSPSWSNLRPSAGLPAATGFGSRAGSLSELTDGPGRLEAKLPGPGRDLIRAGRQVVSGRGPQTRTATSFRAWGRREARTRPPGITPWTPGLFCLAICFGIFDKIRTGFLTPCLAVVFASCLFEAGARCFDILKLSLSFDALDWFSAAILLHSIDTGNA